MVHPYFDYSDDVTVALENNHPVLALESTLISHGMPFPENLETALAAEQIAREEGVTPATIALVNGRIKIGLTEKELEQFAQEKHALKASIRDIPYILSKGLTAGTTVAATLFCAYRAGITLFATGGIGGVHRGEMQDISADLIALSNTPVTVICAGAKAILDLPKTLEFLETYSVPIIGYKTDKLPAFYTSASPHALSMTCDDIGSLSKLVHTHQVLGMQTGLLVANPIPKEHEIPASIIEPAIEKALADAARDQIQGKAITPYLLKAITTITQGKSLAANVALIKNNVRVGAELAAQLHLLK